MGFRFCSFYQLLASNHFWIMKVCPSLKSLLFGGDCQVSDAGQLPWEGCLPQKDTNRFSPPNVRRETAAGKMSNGTWKQPPFSSSAARVAWAQQQRNFSKVTCLATFHDYTNALLNSVPFLCTIIRGPLLKVIRRAWGLPWFFHLRINLTGKAKWWYS